VFLASYPYYSQDRQPGKGHQVAKKAARAVAYVLLCLFAFLERHLLCCSLEPGLLRNGNRQHPLLTDMQRTELLLALLVFWRPVRRLRSEYKALLYGNYIIVSLLMWNLSFFLTSSFTN
jgi:hypothetical protein